MEWNDLNNYFRDINENEDGIIEYNVRIYLFDENGEILYPSDITNKIEEYLENKGINSTDYNFDEDINEKGLLKFVKGENANYNIIEIYG